MNTCEFYSVRVSVADKTFECRTVCLAGARGSVVGLRHYATSRKVTGSSPDEVDFFQLT
jgi:hypothetical protein